MPALSGGYNPRMPAKVLGLAPGDPLVGEAKVPGSKSEAQRAIVCAGLIRGYTHIWGVSDCADVAHALALVQALGVEVDRWPGAVTLKSPATLKAAEPISVGESGTLARLATAVLALTSPPGERFEIRAEGTLRSRTSGPLFDALRFAGAGVEFLGKPGRWPVRVTAGAADSMILLSNPVSSQEVSALLMASAASGQERQVLVSGDIPSRPYVDLTIRVLRWFGALVGSDGGRNGPMFVVRGPLLADEKPFTVDPDASSAAVLLAGACLSGGELCARRLRANSGQGDVGATTRLAQFGCRAWIDQRGLHAGGAPDRGATVDLQDAPDLAPVFAAVAAGAALRAGASSRLTGLATLRRKESDRIDVLARGLTSAGFAIRAGNDYLEIGPRAKSGPPEKVVLNPEGDHRMVFTFALLGLLREGILVEDAECVSKSWPSFWADFAKIGARVVGGDGSALQETSE
jgi:3-phosphoshikimate 1-carboxyvinyltransferase